MGATYDFETISSARAEIDAAGQGCLIVEPKANELFIDIDTAEQRNWYNFNYSKIEQHIGILEVTEKPSPSLAPDHAHIVVTLKRDVTPFERIFLQSILGSDLQREALSWIRLINNDPRPTLFFEKAPAQLTAAS